MRSPLDRRFTAALAAASIGAAAFAPAALAREIDQPVDPASLATAAPAGSYRAGDLEAHRHPVARDADDARYAVPYAFGGARDAGDAAYTTTPAGRDAPVAHTSSNGGFDWSSAGIGAGAGSGAVLMLGGVAVTLVTRRRVRLAR